MKIFVTQTNFNLNIIFHLATINIFLALERETNSFFLWKFSLEPHLRKSQCILNWNEWKISFLYFLPIYIQFCLLYKSKSLMKITSHLQKHMIFSPLIFSLTQLYMGNVFLIVFHMFLHISFPLWVLFSLEVEGKTCLMSDTVKSRRFEGGFSGFPFERFGFWCQFYLVTD